MNGSAENDEPGIGTRATIVAGDEPMPVQYEIEVIDIVENERIIYRRYDGPLIGSGIIELKSLHSGTLFKRCNVYEDALSEEIITELSAGMEKDNLRIKRLIETSLPDWKPVLQNSFLHEIP